MNVLLDTQAFLWLDSSKEKLPAAVQTACSDRDNTLWLSVASVWEMQIKITLGKLRLQRPLENLITDQQRINAVQILPIELAHALELKNLPRHHNDPFDRMLIAQAKHEDWEIVSSDREFAAYPVRVLW